MKPFETALRLLLELHVLMENGQGESQEANDVRDKLDVPCGWYSGNHNPEIEMTGLEKHLLDLVSEALYGDKR